MIAALFGCAQRVALTALSEILVSGCQTVAAPGAPGVVITKDLAQVQNCTPVGNIAEITMSSASAIGGGGGIAAKNAAVGLDGTVILDTGSGGIAYRCAVFGQK